MSDHFVTLNLPGAIFAPLRQIAKVKAQSVEQVVIDQLRSVIEVQLPTLPPDEEAELAAFKFLSDDTLRSIAREQMAAPLQGQMQSLMDRNSAGTLTSEEQQELSALVERGQRLMLRKAWAAGVLMERGYEITGDDLVAE